MRRGPAAVTALAWALFIGAVVYSAFRFRTTGDITYFLPEDAARLCGRDKAGALLARPDGFVAWRAIDEAGAPLEELRRCPSI